MTIKGSLSKDGADVFLHVQTKRAGKVKGESIAPGHDGDIVVKSWSWGAHATSAIGSTQVTGRRSYKALTIVKLIDKASTSLMSALATNDEIKEAKLTLRRAGGDQAAFFVISIQSARVSSIDHVGDADGQTVETVSFAFNKIDVEYRPQQSTGGAGGTTSFSDEIFPA